jgi:hypothetical protein
MISIIIQSRDRKKALFTLCVVPLKDVRRILRRYEDLGMLSDNVYMGGAKDGDPVEV